MTAVVVSGIAEHTGGDPAGGLWAMKVFAKDGDLVSAASKAGITVSPMGVTSPTCMVSTVPWPVTFSDSQKIRGQRRHHLRPRRRVDISR